MYIIDDGILQLTGNGFLLFIIITSSLVFSIIRFIEKYFWYRKECKRLKLELEDMENYTYNGEFYKDLERYYKKRKQWENNR